MRILVVCGQKLGGFRYVVGLFVDDPTGYGRWAAQRKLTNFLRDPASIWCEIQGLWAS
jgi:hypothetical protein